MNFDKKVEIVANNFFTLDCSNYEDILKKVYISGFKRGVERAQASQKHAHWVIKFKWEPLAWDTDPLDWDRYDEKTHSEEVDYYACSNCGYDGGDWKPNYKYCPNCGAKMGEEDKTNE